MSEVEEKQYIPYEPNTLIVWGVTMAIVFMFTQSVIDSLGLVAGGLFLAICMTFSAMIEHNMTKKATKKRETLLLTKKQNFMESVYIFKSIFAILMTALFVKIDAINLIYVVWIFTIGFTSFIAGHILNQKSFTYHGVASAMIAYGIIYLIYFSPNGMQGEGLSYLFRTLAVITIGGGYIWLGFEMKKELKRN